MKPEIHEALIRKIITAAVMLIINLRNVQKPYGKEINGANINKRAGINKNNPIEFLFI